MIVLLRDYVDVFTWSYEDMPGLDTDIVVHRVPLVEGCKPFKQKEENSSRGFNQSECKNRKKKQWNAGFLEVVKYPQ